MRNAASDKELQTGITTIDTIPCPVVLAFERIGDDVTDRRILAIWSSGKFWRDRVILWLPICVAGDVCQVKKVCLEQVSVESGVDGVATFAVSPDELERAQDYEEAEKR